MTGQCIASDDLDMKKLWDSTCELPTCKRETSTAGPNPKTRVEVPLLTCNCLWRRFQKEAEDWVAPGGVLIADPQARNRKINAAYAQLWLADNRFQWAGLAAFASKQVGCGLIHATKLQTAIAAQKAAQEKLRTAPSETLFEGFGFKFSKTNPEAEQELAKARAANPMPTEDITFGDNPRSLVQQQLDYVYEMLALGNTSLFLDVYPLHRFFMVRGYKEMEKCLRSRRGIGKDVMWPIANKVQFGIDAGEIYRTFEAIDAGEIAESVQQMARHEQLNILQPAMYEDTQFATLMRGTHAGNYVSVVTGMFSGAAEEIQLTLASQCKAPDNRQVSFSKNPIANLADRDQRMEFVLRAAGQFDALLKNPATRAQLKQSITDIANGGGIK
ncbi:hypothetical protein NX10_03015 [Pseudomonas fluorescens]|uniref:DUF2515 family protein n=1 Tax=Pseudomonas fluorescens group TaxID=136843 RepID=UPI00058459E8|nr:MULTISPECIES: hypothetical protein [Pseudomonas fluorescens group]KIF64504.1 hypothetical protein NX10_03015 [Pseudomonas fluorescens]MDR7052692.1 hypothetical protein [Pseudomonas koreensis]